MGRVAKPCEICGAEKVVGHHDDYSKPYEIRWLCHKHHSRLHAALAKAGRQIKATPEQKREAWRALWKIRQPDRNENYIKLRIDEATHADLQARAREAERSVAAEIRLAIRKHLERTSA